MQIYDKPLGWLTPYENNPRNNDEAVGPGANSISEFGFKVPIVATSDGEIINGHTRWKAAKKLKLKTVPVIIADDLTEEQVRAFRLADNKVAEIAQWDIELLLDEIENINNVDMGFLVLPTATTLWMISTMKMGIRMRSLKKKVKVKMLNRPLSRMGIFTN